MPDTKPRKTLTPKAKEALERKVDEYRTTCPTHKVLLLTTRTTNQRVCPKYDCDFWLDGKAKP